MTRRLEIVDLGQRDYLETLALQRQLRLDLIEGRRDADLLLLVEHPPVYTLGRGTRDSSLPVPVELLEAAGAEVVKVERGGDVTWHGPGQLVGYPIIDLRFHRQDLHWYLRRLEGALIAALARIGIDADRVPGKTGVWVEDRKIASIGVHVKQWVTLHGFALNVGYDLAWFDRIVPCGISGVRMTSIAHELGGDSASWWGPARASVIEQLAATFDLAPVETTLDPVELANPTRTIHPSHHG